MKAFVMISLALIVAFLGYFVLEREQAKEAVIASFWATPPDPEIRRAQARVDDVEGHRTEMRYQERRQKERAEKTAEFNAEPTKVLQRLQKLVALKHFDEACGMAADYDGVVNADFRKIVGIIEGKVGVRCSN